MTLYANTLAEARAEFRKFLFGADTARKRLPRGCEVWES